MTPKVAWWLPHAREQTCRHTHTHTKPPQCRTNIQYTNQPPPPKKPRPFADYLSFKVNSMESTNFAIFYCFCLYFVSFFMPESHPNIFRIFEIFNSGFFLGLSHKWFYFFACYSCPQRCYSSISSSSSIINLHRQKHCSDLTIAYCTCIETTHGTS